MISLKNIKLLIIATVLSVVFSSCAQNTAKKEAKDGDTKQSVVELISSEDLYAKLGDIQLIDVRTPNEFAEGYLKGAKMINYFDNDFLEQMSKLDKNKELYVYCRSGNRSGKAAKKLKSMGFVKIYDLKGGILSWKRKNLEIVK